MMLSSRALGYALLRCTLGLVFLFYGVDKFGGGFLQFAQAMRTEFAQTWIPAWSTYGFASVLPFLEVTAGVLLTLGLFTRFAAVLCGVLIIVLTTGKTVEGNSLTVAENLVFAIVIFLLLQYIDRNEFSVDAWRKTRSRQTFSER